MSMIIADPKTRLKPLYAFNWTVGGFNQVYAYSKREAVQKAKTVFGGTNLVPDESSFRALRTAAEQAKYWRGIPNMD